MSMTLKASTARERFHLLHLHPALGMYERLSMVYLIRLAVGCEKSFFTDLVVSSYLKQGVE